MADINYKMLEIKNVTKIYNTKGGVVTHALNDVSISFGETGLVFLLGKSGSGKSTLLNVSGGLDEPTSGEIIVKGKSSRDFTGSDFDSYRNTFVGFIFQEYNILDEFNVEDNIALALELQGKNKDKDKIQAILRDVELEAYAKRKPNTLSGGQKQRIAIARALVKDPQIIMADEPTGALDSATGKQVFDTLKRLSKTRLVIVVSHDREFAEIYGDRIVELADGKIISDVVKTHVSPTEIDENVALIGENTLSIKKGTSLTPENIKTIQEFIQKTEGDVIISNGQKEISSFKKVNRMSDSGETEKFKDTPQDIVVHKDYTAEESKFIRSRLPAGKAIRIGASGLKVKPVRLAFTILLSVIAFIMFGLFSTLMLYDGDQTLVTSFADSEVDSINILKYYVTHVEYMYEDFEYDVTTRIRFTDDDLKQFQQKFDNGTIGYRKKNVIVSNVEIGNKTLNYYSSSINKFAVASEGNDMLNKINGAYPQNAHEICISSYLFDVIKENYYYEVTVGDDYSAVKPANPSHNVIKTENDIIGKYIVLNLGGEKAFKVTGVFDCGKVSAKYDELKEPGEHSNLLTSEYARYLDEGTKLVALVSDDFFDEYSNSFTISSSGGDWLDCFRSASVQLELSCNKSVFDIETGEWVQSADTERITTTNDVLAFENNRYFQSIFLDGNKKSLADDEVLIRLDTAVYDDFFKKDVIDYFMSISQEADTTSKYNDAEAKYEAFIKDFDVYSGGGKMDENGYFVEAGPAERLEILARLMAVIEKVKPTEVTLSIDGTKQTKFKVAGFYYHDNPLTYYDNGLIFSDNFIQQNVPINTSIISGKYETTKYEFEEGQKYDGLLIPYDGSTKMIRDVVNILGIENRTENDVSYSLDSVVAGWVDIANSFVEMLSTVFLWIGVVFAVFSSLLLFNFISVSISNKRKEIGILRAVGARGLDVFKIFFSESGIIVGICTVIAVIGTLILCGVINGIIRTEGQIPISIFVFGPASIGILIGIAVVVAVISTFLPVFFASRKKPVESIRAL